MIRRCRRQHVSRHRVDEFRVLLNSIRIYRRTNGIINPRMANASAERASCDISVNDGNVLLGNLCRYPNLHSIVVNVCPAGRFARAVVLKDVICDTIILASCKFRTQA